MFTEKQLANWRKLGFTFGPDMDKFAVKTPPKKLSITLASIKSDDTNYYVSFNVTSQSLEIVDAQFWIKEKNKVIANTVIASGKTAIKKSGTVVVKMTFAKNVLNKLNPDFEYGGFEFTGTIVCDGLTAETASFNFNKVGKNETSVKDNKCICEKKEWTAENLKFVITKIRMLDTRPINRKHPDKNKNHSWLDKDGKVIPSTDRGGRPKEAVSKLLDPYDLPFYEEVDYTNVNQIKDRLFYMVPADTNIPNNKANYTDFVKELNMVFNKYKIDTCNRRTNFLANVYVETQHLSLTCETSPRDTVHGGELYRGRGIKQITHDYNYLHYYQDTHPGNTMYDDYYKYREKRAVNVVQETVEAFKIRTKDKYISDEQLKAFKEFVPLLATDLHHACNSAGWYWNLRNINVYADKDDYHSVAALINNPDALGKESTAGIVDYNLRVKYHDMLQLIFDENCK